MQGIRVREAELAGELGGCLGCVGEPFGKGSWKSHGTPFLGVPTDVLTCGEDGQGNAACDIITSMRSVLPFST